MTIQEQFKALMEEADDSELEILIVKARELIKQRVITSNIWVLKRFDSVGYDEYEGFVVRAPTEPEARALCPFGDEDDIWVDPTKVHCTRIIAGPVAIILAAFNAG